jgi:hypothetical protein
MGFYWKINKQKSSDENHVFGRYFIIENQTDWLYSRGGRSLTDVFSDSGGNYVEMTTLDGSNKVYIPTVF